MTDPGGYENAPERAEVPATSAYEAVRRCLHDGHFVHAKGRYGTFADGRDAQPCGATNDWGQ